MLPGMQMFDPTRKYTKQFLKNALGVIFKTTDFPSQLKLLAPVNVKRYTKKERTFFFSLKDLANHQISIIWHP